MSNPAPGIVVSLLMVGSFCLGAAVATPSAERAGAFDAGAYQCTSGCCACTFACGNLGVGKCGGEEYNAYCTCRGEP